MLNWFRRWQYRRSRAIFPYFDGRRKRLGDPLRFHRALLANESFLQSDWEMIELGGEETLRAAARLAVVARETFGIAEVDDGGLTDMDCVLLLRQFMGYASIQKKSGVSTQTQQPHTDMQPLSTSEDGTLMSDDTGSGSTPNGSSSGPPQGHQPPL